MNAARTQAYEEFLNRKPRVTVPYEAFNAGWNARAQTLAPLLVALSQRVAIGWQVDGSGNMLKVVFPSTVELDAAIEQLRKLPMKGQQG